MQTPSMHEGLPASFVRDHAKLQLCCELAESDL